MIIDNHSDIPVETSLREVLIESKVEYKIFRNPVNVGLFANVMRCFEYCETSYLWIIGDDDLANFNAIKTIFSYLENFPEFVLFNFSTAMLKRAEDTHTKGLFDLLDNIDVVGNFGYLPASIYNVEKLRQNIRIGYHYTYSFYPHLALLFYSLNDDSQCLISKEQIALFTKYPTEEQRWSEIARNLGMPILLDIPNDYKAKQKLFEVINRGMSGYKSFAVALMERAIISGNKESARYLYEQIVSRRIFFESRLYQKIAVKFYRLLFQLSPKLGVKLLKNEKYNSFAKKIATEDPTRRM
jgi:hypothetical protein